MFVVDHDNVCVTKDLVNKVVKVARMTAFQSMLKHCLLVEMRFSIKICMCEVKLANKGVKSTMFPSCSGVEVLYSGKTKGTSYYKIVLSSNESVNCLDETQSQSTPLHTAPLPLAPKPLEGNNSTVRQYFL